MFNKPKHGERDMRAKLSIVIAGMLMCSGSVLAAAPDGYYPSVVGHDAESARAALNAVLEEADPIPYSSTAFDTHDAVDILDAVPGDDGFVNLVYSDDVASTDSWPGYNREHVWPQSYGADPGSPAHSDLHHIFACDSNVNSARSNQPFGECEEDCSSHVEAPEAMYNGHVFEPPAEEKGNIARALLYMDVRYEGNNGEPDLQLINGEVSVGCDCMGSLDTLLEWHLSDPVDERERLRNDEVYAIQGNRNPFIDRPEWVYVLYNAVTVVEEEEPVVEDTPQEEETLLTAFMRPISESDGHILERTEGSGLAGAVMSRAHHIGLGDTLDNRASVGMVAFDLTHLPEGAVVTGAVLHLTQTISANPDIFNRLGALQVEFARGGLGDSADLDGSDFADDSGIFAAGRVEEMAGGLGSLIPVEINPDVLRYIERGDTAEFRLRFETPSNGDDMRDMMGIGSGDHPSIWLRPTLEVLYTLP